MFSIAWTFDRLIEAAAISLVLFTVGSLAVLCCRQPVRRMRIILLTLAGSVLAPLVNLWPGLPHWSLPAIRSIAAPDQVRQTQQQALAAASAKIADSRSSVLPAASNETFDTNPKRKRGNGLTPSLALRVGVRSGRAPHSEPPATEAEEDAGPGEPTALTDPASEVPEPSSEPLPALVASVPAATFRQPSAVAAPEQPALPLADSAAIPHRIDPARVIVGSYLVGAAALAIWWVLGFAGLRRLLRTARPAPECCRTLLREIAGPAGDRVRLLVSPRAPQPFTFGWYRPVIVLPQDMARSTELSGEPQSNSFSPELIWSLAHEWSHVARGDVRVWSFAGLVRLVYYYQPLCWWLRRELRLCQDYLADAAAAQESSPEIYAEFLAARGVGRPLAVGLGIAGGKSDLYRRIVMLVQNRRLLETHCPRWWTVAAATGAIALVVLAATCTGKPESLAAASEPAGSATARSGTRESSDIRQTPAPNSGESNDAGENTPADGELLSFRDAPNTADQETTAAERDRSTDKEAVAATARNVPEAETKQKLLDGMFARATAIKSGRFETTASRTRNGKNTVLRWRFIVSGETWSRTRVSDQTKPGTGTNSQELEVIGARHYFWLTRNGSAGGKAEMQPSLTINWPTSAIRAFDAGASPPFQAGTFWHRMAIPCLRDHSNAARLRGAVRVKDYETQVVEWTIPGDAAQAAFVKLDNLLSGGGIYRAYVSEELGFALARIECIDRFGTPQCVYDFSEFHELAPGMHFPRTVHIQEAGEDWHMDIREAANVNEPIDDRELMLKIPPRTAVHDERPHLGDRTGRTGREGPEYDARKYPLRKFTTGAEYPDGLPAAMLAEMDRDAVSPEELRASQTRPSKEAANQPAKATADKPPEKTTGKAAEKTQSEQVADENSAASAKPDQDLPAKNRLLYGGKNFRTWRGVLLTELEAASRIKALHALGELGANGYAEEAAGTIAEILKVGSAPDIDQIVHEKACIALARLGTAGIPALESQLSSSDWSARHHALNSLVSLAAKTDAVVPALLKAAGDDIAQIRERACAALAQNFLAAPGVVEVLTAALNDNEKLVRLRLIESLIRSKVPADKALELLKLALHDKDGQLRGTAAYLIGTRMPASAENAALLRQIVSSSTTDCVGTFLAKLNNQALIPSPAVAEMLVPSLIAIIESGEPNPKLHKQHVESSLRILSGLAREKAAVAAIPVLIKSVQARGPANNLPYSFSASSAEILGRIGPAAAEALPALQELLDSVARIPETEEFRATLESAIRSIEGKGK